MVMRQKANTYLSYFIWSLPRSNKALADSLDQAVDPHDPVVNRMLRMMATQAMSNALYFYTGACSEELYYHYGQ